MRYFKAIDGIAAASFVLVIFFSAAIATGQAAVLESARIDNWTLNAYSSDKTGHFHVCSMKSAGNDQVSLTVSANPRNRWYLWLYRAEWDFDVDSRFVAALTLDSDRKNAIALDAKVTNDRFVQLYLPPDRRVLDLFLRADTARVSAEGHIYTFPLGGYAKAVAWMKDCVRRNNALEAVKAPDATIRGEDDDDTDASGIQGRKNKRPEVLKVVPKAIPQPAVPKSGDVIIEVNAQHPPVAPAPLSPPALTQSPIATALATLFAPSHAALPSSTPPVASNSPSSQTASLSDAARATLTPTEQSATAAPKPGELLLPRLMAAANRSDFKLLETSAAASTTKRADVNFSLSGVTGAVLTFDLPTPEAAVNEVLAYDRVACDGAYSAVTDPPDDSQPHVMRASSQCLSGDKAIATHYLTLPKKAGGYFVVSLWGAAPEGSDSNAPLIVADQALLDAAIKVSGQF